MGSSREEPEDTEAPTRAIASLQQSPWQIREQNANLFNVISSAFRIRCAQGRLLDCASHLPK